MLELVIGVCWFLIALCILVGLGWLVIWVLGQLGIPVPEMVVKIAMLIIALLCLIYFLTIFIGGGAHMPVLR